MKTLILITALLAVAGSLQAAPFSKVRKNIAYRNDDPACVLDLYYPQTNSQTCPVHIFIHGGGWRVGSKNIGGLTAELFNRLAEKGFLGVSVEYRKVNEQKNIYMRESTVDALDAVRYVAAHAAELGADPENIFVWGQSAGGHLTLMAATATANAELSESPELAAADVHLRGAVAFYPPCDMENYETISIEKNGGLRPLSDRMGRHFKDEPEAYREISPFCNLSADCPPVLIFHGDSDGIVNMEHSLRFKRKADQLGTDCTLQIVQKAGHGFRRDKEQSPSVDEILDRVVGFFTGRVAAAQ